MELAEAVKKSRQVLVTLEDYSPADQDLILTIAKKMARTDWSSDVEGVVKPLLSIVAGS